MISRYFLWRVLGVSAFTAYMFWLGYTARPIWNSGNTALKVGHAVSVVADIAGLIFGLLTL